MELPHNTASETDIICSLLLYPELIYTNPNLKESQFFDVQKGCLFWAIKNLISKNIKIEPRNILSEIKGSSSVSKVLAIDTETMLNELMDLATYRATSESETYKKMTKDVLALAFKRELYSNIKKIENKCLTDKTDDISSIHTEISNTINGLVEKFIADENIVDFGKKVESLWEALIQARNKDGTFGISSAWKCFDDYFTYQDGELILFSARRKTGKSIIGMNETYHKLKCGLAVVYFDTEMSDLQFYTRLLSHITQIPEVDIKKGNLTDSEEIMLSKTNDWLKKQKLIHEYNPRWTKEDVITKCRILHNQGKLDFFIYDYFKDTSGKNTNSSDIYNELGNWCDAIKNHVLGALNIKGIAFAQLNREGRIADSDKIERYASTGITFRKKTDDEIKKDGKDCGNYAMSVDFNRIGDIHDGEGEYLDFLFKGKTLTISETKKQHEKHSEPFE